MSYADGAMSNDGALRKLAETIGKRRLARIDRSLVRALAALYSACNNDEAINQNPDVGLAIQNLRFAIDNPSTVRRLIQATK